jgi:multidrug efflux pump subunit AcrB
LSNIVVGIVIVLLVLAFHFQDWLEPWLVRLSLGALFCTVIYLREHPDTDRGLTIAIIAAGTLLSLVLMR